MTTHTILNFIVMYDESYEDDYGVQSHYQLKLGDHVLCEEKNLSFDPSEEDLKEWAATQFTKLFQVGA